MPDRKYIVCKYTNSGFGDHMSCLFGSWMYALKTDRKLIIDWRGSRFTKDNIDLFFRYFQNTDKLVNIEISGADSYDKIKEPIYPKKWDKNLLISNQHLPHTANEVNEVSKLVLESKDIDEPTIVINQHILGLDNIAYKNSLASLANELKFKTEITQEADKFIAENFQNKTIIAIHIRHGNGENIFNRSAYWLPALALIKQLLINLKTSVHGQSIQAKSLMAEYFGNKNELKVIDDARNIIEKIKQDYKRDSIAVLLLTDSELIEKKIKEKIENIYSYKKKFELEGKGALHEPNLATLSIKELLIEQELLLRASEIIYIPSQFTFWARLRLPQEKLHKIQPTLINRLILRLFNYYSIFFK